MFSKSKRRIYLDYASLAPEDTSLYKVPALPLGNPGSLGQEGVRAKRLLEESREKVAGVLHAHQDEVIFTSGGTEGDNIAFWGTLLAYEGNQLPHVIISSIEHPAVRESALFAKERGLIRLTEISVDERGIISTAELREALTPDTILVSIMTVNNEIGTIEPIEEIAKTIRHFKKDKNTPYPLFHTDACQAPSVMSLDIRSLHVDLLTLNGGKVYAGAGVGMLYARRGIPVKGVFHGGDQERGLRPGTENVIGIARFAEALLMCEKRREEETQKYERLRGALLGGLEDLGKRIEGGVVFVSDKASSAPHIVSISFPSFPSEHLVIELDAQGIAVSSRSACTTDSDEPSHVVRALGKNISPDIGTVRFSFGRWTKDKDISQTLRALEKIFVKYKKMQ